MKKIAYPLLALTMIGCSFNKGLEKKIFEEKISEKKEINFIVIYNQDNLRFRNFSTQCKSIKDSLEKKYPGKINFEIHEINNYEFDYADSLRANKQINSLKGEIDSVWSNFVKNHGPIDRAILGFHSDENFSALNLYGKPKINLLDHSLSKGDVHRIASKNKNAKKLFDKDSKLIYLGCSAGRGDNSIAEIFFNEYNINEVLAPEEIYWGDVIWDDGIYLTNKNHKKYPRRRGFKYVELNGDTCYQDFSGVIRLNITKNDLEMRKYSEISDWLFTASIKKDKTLRKNNYSLLRKKMEEKKYQILDWNKPIENFYRVKKFKQKH